VNTILRSYVVYFGLAAFFSLSCEASGDSSVFLSGNDLQMLSKQTFSIEALPKSEWKKSSGYEVKGKWPKICGESAQLNFKQSNSGLRNSYGNGDTQFKTLELRISVSKQCRDLLKPQINDVQSRQRVDLIDVAKSLSVKTFPKNTASITIISLDLHLNPGASDFYPNNGVATNGTSTYFVRSSKPGSGGPIQTNISYTPCTTSGNDQTSDILNCSNHYPVKAGLSLQAKRVRIGPDIRARQNPVSNQPEMLPGLSISFSPGAQ
jgi:hypothetical protein